MKKALITGITGQDGSYLAEFLLSKGYEVHGLRRRNSSPNNARIEHLLGDRNFSLHYGDLQDSGSLAGVISKLRPTEIYNLAAQSHVHSSFETAEYTSGIDGIGVLKLLEVLRSLGMENATRFYQASTSELFGGMRETAVSESDHFHPRSPYGVAKLFAHWIVVNYREAYNMFACNGILFNHESPKRGYGFVTRKVTLGMAGIVKGEKKKISLGNLDAKRDWGHAQDYVRAMWMMLQQQSPKDYLIATGETHSVRDFVESCFHVVGIDLVWRGEGVDEVAVIDALDDSKGCYHTNVCLGQVVVDVDPYFFRPSEVSYLKGDASAARVELGWEPLVSFADLVREMVLSDLRVEDVHHRRDRS